MLKLGAKPDSCVGYWPCHGGGVQVDIAGIGFLQYNRVPDCGLIYESEAVVAVLSVKTGCRGFTGLS